MDDDPAPAGRLDALEPIPDETLIAAREVVVSGSAGTQLGLLHVQYDVEVGTGTVMGPWIEVVIDPDDPEMERDAVAVDDE